ncbi:hypothetical protein F511_16847 [Dorcoceras hygrometricum]|uniref:Protein root UVB sensitive/RUS domain-containing protein n=1 Tax=Dorcoceras hygrometricum TaxID=472368 RepID=A0A2Z7CL04_9LAMI|nr:hypothetical protein F511_16847 [Dorcoceras hygrometricum]
MHSNSWFIVAHNWMCCCLRLVVQLVVTICLQLVVQSLVSNACDCTSHDWVDQTMSYQIIQTTSFAMHPRLVECNAEALVWMYCICLLVSCDCWLSPSQNLPADSYRECKTPSFQLIQATSFCNRKLQISSAGLGFCWKNLLLDGAGRIGKMLFAGQGKKFEDLKKLRFAGDLLMELGAGVELVTAAVSHLFLPLTCAANVAKNVGAVTSTSTRTPIYKAFARGENIGDVTAKGECAGNIFDLVCFPNWDNITCTL